jgi:hypothetical protein
MPSSSRTAAAFCLRSAAIALMLTALALAATIASQA